MNLIFDLDGTLIDSKKGIFNAYKLSLEDYIEPVSETKFKNNIGPPFFKFLNNLHPDLDNNISNTVIKNFRRLYDEIYFKDFEIYNGINELIDKVSNFCKCFIITNKPTNPSIEIIRKLNLNQYFEEIIGINYFSENGLSKTDNISKLILKKNLSKKITFYIGDTKADFDASLQNNINFIAFTKGYYSWKNEELLDIFYHYDNPHKLLNKLRNLR